MSGPSRWSIARFLAAVAVLLGACTSREPAAPPAAVCDLDAAARVASAGLVPPPADPLLPPPTLRPDDTLPGYPGVVIDPHPLGRGDHPVLRYWVDPASCELSGGAFPYGPPHPGADPTPTSRLIGRGTNASDTLRALVVTGADPGSASDVLAWHGALVALGASGVHLHAPSRTALETALTERLCADVGPGDTALLVTTGPGVTVDAGASSGLLLGAEAVSFRRLAEQLTADCADAGLVVWVADASHAAEAALPARLGPTVVWRASDAAVPDAPRLGVEAGGTLSLALAQHLAEHAAARCLAAADATPGELLATFAGPVDVPAGPAVRARMAALRWTGLGAPALDAAGLASGAEADARARLAALLDAQLPYDLLTVTGGPLPGGRCTESGSCIQLAQGCSLSPCERWSCQDGHCVPKLAPGRDCDDDNPCTSDDACDASGLCRGTVRKCDDGNPCTVDGCEADLGCVSVPSPAGGACDDGDACTEADRCDDAGTCGGDPVTCDDGDECTNDGCDPAEGCEFVVAKNPCDDGDPCTVLDFCLSGICRGQPRPCDDGEPCTLDGCDVQTGACLPLALPDGSACSDGDVCTALDRCVGGVCTGELAACDDGLDCTLDLCDLGVCSHLPVPGTCATASGCVPVGQKDPGDPCHVCAATSVFAPAPDGAACPDDGFACTTDFCSGGACVHPNLPGTCSTPDGGCVAVGEALGPCLVCSATGTASPAGAGAHCDDGAECTAGDTCDALGTCSGAPLGCCPAGPDAQCGAKITGETGDPAYQNAISTWSCIPGATFHGREHAHTFVAPCAGPVQLTFTGPPASLLFVVRGDLDLCGEGVCTTYTAGPIAQNVAAGEVLTLVVDGQAQLPGPYTIDVWCPCDALGAP